MKCFLTLSVLVMSNDSSQMRDFFLFPFRALKTVVDGVGGLFAAG